MSRGELADFLRRRREALRPEEVPGVPVRPHGRRRTPGLRREEVAELAGVSLSYYERLEQARGPRPSAQVLGALGSALRLSAPEVEHLARLAEATPAVEPVRRGSEPASAGPDAGPAGPPVPDDARRLLDRLGAIPAYLVDDRQDVVAWNPAAAALIVDFARLPAGERNVARLSVRLGGTLCAEPGDDTGEWARALAADLRVTRARHPADRVLAELVNSYAAHSPEFVAGWRSHDVRPRPALRKRLRHPELGELDLEVQTLMLPGTDLRLVVHTAEPGSPSAAALARLGDPGVDTSRPPVAR